MTKKKKGIQGESAYGYDERKRPFNVSLTPTAIAGYESVAQKLGKSRSQVIEELGRVDETKLIELLNQPQEPNTEALLRFCQKVEKKAI